MEMLLLTPRDSSYRKYENCVTATDSVSSRFAVGQTVEYYSTSRKKWFETLVTRVNSDGTVDVACRAGVDSNALRASALRFEIGSRVEYYSDSMKAWVMSYVKGVNADGTYRLNTKKCADPSRIRLLMASVLVETPPKASSPLVVRVPGISGLDLCGGEILQYLPPCSAPTITRMSGFSGGQNGGIWFVSSNGVKVYCLKLVSRVGKYESVLPEREAYLLIASKFPSIRFDESIKFPCRILTGLFLEHDVIVMPVARGERMAEVVGTVVRAPQGMKRIALIFHAVGATLHQFHKKYNNTQHGDLQSSNIFVHNDTTVEFIDVGGMTKKSATPDTEYFRESIRLVGKTYGLQFITVATRAFDEGYASGF